jgi:hypothetical protein
MGELKCPLDPLCHVWSDLHKDSVLYRDRDGCLFTKGFDVLASRNMKCPFPVEIIYARLEPCGDSQ